MHFGLIRERKTPPDHRAVLSPAACQKVLSDFPEAQITVESSPIRVFTDQEYRDADITVSDSIAHCDVLLGVKEVPISELISNKKYFFFSHTIKKQPYNRKLLQTILDKNIEFYDHEVITNPQGIRLVAFGRFAGIVGAYNGIRAYGLKHKIYELPKAQSLKDRQALIEKLNEIRLPAVKILVTGKGRVGGGVREMLAGMNLKEVTVDRYINNTFDEAVFCQIDVLDYNRRKDGTEKDMQDFFEHPEDYEANFLRFTPMTDLYLAAHFHASAAPRFFSITDTKRNDFKISVIADISCDIDGPVPTTIKASTIQDPIYGVERGTGKEVDYLLPDSIAVMAVDNLPAELPRDASRGFGFTFVEEVVPSFFNGDAKGILDRARMTLDGKLTPNFTYLQDYVEGK